MKVSIAQRHTLRRIAACRHSLLEASGQLRKHVNSHIHRDRMGNGQSSTEITENVKPVDEDVEAPTPALEAAEGRPVLNLKSPKSETSTQTDPVEEGGYDMRAPRRKCKLFGVVTVVGDNGERSVVPSADEKRQSCCLSALVEYLRHLVRRTCGCSWLDDI